MSDLAYPIDLAPEDPHPHSHEESLPAEPPGTPSVVSISPLRIPSSPAPESRRQQAFYIDVPHLSWEEKAQYGPVPDVVVESEDELDCIELRSVIGEYTEDGSLYYYAVGSGGLARRYHAKRFKEEYPDLVKQFEEDKANGNLPSFDPSGEDVEPTSRAKIYLRLPKTRKTRSSYRDSPLYIDGTSEEDDDNDEAYGERSYAPRGGLSKRNTRSTTKLLSSRTRAKRGNGRPASPSPLTVLDDSESEESYERPIKRSTRSKKVSSVDEEYEDDGQDGSTTTSFSGRQQTAEEDIVRGIRSIPVYGNVRPVVELPRDAKVDDVFHAHRHDCEKCHQPPAHDLLEDLNSKKKRKNREVGDVNQARKSHTALGGWVRCLKCSLCAHWNCLAHNQREEILNAVLERDRAIWRNEHPPPDPAKVSNEADGAPHIAEPQKRLGLDAYQTTEFVCGSCMKGGFCMGCKQLAVEPEIVLRDARSTISSVIPGVPKPKEPANAPADHEPAETPIDIRLFRCATCKRLAHYEHLTQPRGSEFSKEELANYYQNEWKCADCLSYSYQAEHILAWRPFPENAVEPFRPIGEVANYKANLPREYLVKWAERSYRRTQWVPHGWLLSMVPNKLRSFLASGSRIKLLDQPAVDAPLDETLAEPDDAFDIGVENPTEDMSSKSDTDHVIPSDAIPDADKRINPAWKRVDRVLDVWLWYPEKILKKRAAEKKRKSRGRWKETSNDGMDEETSERMELLFKAAFADGQQPSYDFMETLDDWEKRTHEQATNKLIDSVVWAYIKWDDLGYEQATEDSPPSKSDPGYPAFRDAFHRFIASRSVAVKSLHKKEDKAGYEQLLKTQKFRPFSSDRQPQLGQSSRLTLMPFQVDGINWLCNNYRNFQNCILADEMGLGKTVQVVTSLGVLFQKYGACPALVVVPNSTISNWVREFERWAPELRVCPFYGEAKAREVIKGYELYHSMRPPVGITRTKFHVLVTTYETVTNPKEFTAVFKQVHRWELLVIDEGQRLKNDSSLIFKRLRELNTRLRVILTGTPLNNNIRELFNLMNFLDPTQWTDLENLAKEHEELTEDRVKELHSRLRPYFLRRIKAEVLQLPPKNEVIVPVSMAPLQKEIYRSILSQNLELLKNITQGTGSKMNNNVKKTNMNNLLMQLRKCLQHPYLVSREIEPSGLSPVGAHEKLIDASAKLRILKTLLPKLKERGHRVLLFSQFVIALDVIEDFLVGEGVKYLRLDGNTKQFDRQKGMDEFNKPDSDVFIYLLTTRAGGVGINLWSADTVIIFDPDFNPHQDLQAIARSHRYGQKKTCLVFKLMVKDSAEERIMHAGKKKLVLDHLIVQKMDDDESKEDVQSILMFGAKQLFEAEGDQSAKDIHYSEHDIDKLIEKTETEGDQPEQHVEEGSTLFSFAKVWSADKDTLEEMADEEQEPVAQDSWAQTLQKIAAERHLEVTQEATGRGVRRKAAAVFPAQATHLGNTPQKKGKHKKNKKHKSKAAISDDSDAYAPPPQVLSDEETSYSGVSLSGVPLDLDNFQPGNGPSAAILPPFERHGAPHGQSNSNQPAEVVLTPAPLTVQNGPPVESHRGQQPRPSTEEVCGLCGTPHPPGICFMTESSQNLAEYRNILLLHPDDEPLDERRAAIEVIDETLAKRGKIDLIYGQPLRLVTPRNQRKPTKSTLARLPPAIPTETHYAPKTSNGQSTRLERPSIRPEPIPASSSRPRSVPRPTHLPSASTPQASGSTVPAGQLEMSNKRSLSPARQSSSKRMKVMDASSCVICGQSPHLVHDCPVVKQGSKSTHEVIKRLESDPSNDQTVLILRKILRKQLRREQKAALARAVVVND